ncbi:MAG: FAD:protein FMN transferase ApbE [Candidatus Marinimicrobia bacterium]|nr:FAD:protein FMN transferase ApbE [Candidatus Neomarinimicrobiota bacterium]MBF89729.1 FAD:protein FMN transferase ApbE [Candidatus Neomarinimicrobiota bacterium]|tara:strand:+ start:915 stop:1961 length:1047 start_codon:yes stop_codon:yes gene_type:complete
MQPDKTSLNLLSFVMVLIGGCSIPSDPIRLEGVTMGTTYQVKYIPKSNVKAPTTIKIGIDSVLKEINRQMSTYIPDSEISSFNRLESTKSIPVSEEFHYVVNRSVYWAEKTNGAFDITIFPLLFLWGFGPGGKGFPDIFPDSTAILKRLLHVGSKNILIENHTLKKLDKFISIDLNAIAKGFGVDAVYKYLISQDISDMMVEIGGEVRAKGNNSKSKPWTIAIERPSLSGDILEGFDWIVNLENKAMATSGDYRNYFEVEGKIYSHEIDPRTGYPSITGVASATVIAPNCTDADAIATALMIMNVDEGMKLIEDLPQVEALLLIRDKSNQFISLQSSGMNARSIGKDS